MTIDEIFRHTAARFGISDTAMTDRVAERGVICIPRNVAIMVSAIAGHDLRCVAERANRTIQATRQVVKRVSERRRQLRLVRTIWDEVDGREEPFIAMVGYMPEPAYRDEFALSGWSELAESGDVVPERQRDPNLYQKVFDALGIDQVVFEEPALHQAMIRQAVIDFMLGADASRWMYRSWNPPGGPGVSFAQACETLGLDPDRLRKQILALPTLDEFHNPRRDP